MRADRFHAADDSALDREIRALFAVDPSPQFHASVRRRIANAPAAADRRHLWTFGAAAAAAALTALVVTAPSRRAAPRPALVARPIVGLAPPIAPQMGRRSEDIASASVRAVPAKREPPRRSEPEILLAPDETRALRALIAGVRDGRIDLTPVTQATTPDVMDLEPIRNLVIAPLVILPVEGVHQ